MKVGDLVKRKRAIYENNSFLSSNPGIIIERNRYLVIVKWTDIVLPKYTAPQSLEVISESR